MAREYEERITFLTSPGLDEQPAMVDFVKRYRWPDSIVNAVDENGDLWAHFGVRFRGTWLMVNQDGSVNSQSSGHISEKDLRSRLESLVRA